MKKYSISDIANLLKVAQMTVYRKVKKLKKELTNHSGKEKGVLFFTPEGVEIIRASILTAPGEAIFEAIQPAPVTVDLSPVVSRFNGMETGILALIEAFRNETKSLHGNIARLGETISRLAENNQALQNEVSSLRKDLEYKGTEEKPTLAKEENAFPVVASDTAAPIRERIANQVTKQPEVQRQLTMFENFKVLFDDLAGFVLGRG